MTTGSHRRVSRSADVRRVVTRLLVGGALLGAVALAGCKDSVAPPRLLNVSAAQLADITASIADARIRLAPSLQQAATGTALAAALSGLETALATKEVTKIAAAVAAVKQVLTSSAATAPAGDAPDRDAVSVALTVIDLAVSSS